MHTIKKYTRFVRPGTVMLLFISGIGGVPCNAELQQLPIIAESAAEAQLLVSWGQITQSYYEILRPLYDAPLNVHQMQHLRLVELGLVSAHDIPLEQFELRRYIVQDELDAEALFSDYPALSFYAPVLDLRVLPAGSVTTTTSARFSFQAQQATRFHQRVSVESEKNPLFAHINLTHTPKVTSLEKATIVSPILKGGGKLHLEFGANTVAPSLIAGRSAGSSEHLVMAADAVLIPEGSHSALLVTVESNSENAVALLGVRQNRYYSFALASLMHTARAGQSTLLARHELTVSDLLIEVIHPVARYKSIFAARTRYQLHLLGYVLDISSAVRAGNFLWDYSRSFGAIAPDSNGRALLTELQLRNSSSANNRKIWIRYHYGAAPLLTTRINFTGGTGMLRWGMSHRLKMQLDATEKTTSALRFSLGQLNERKKVSGKLFCYFNLISDSSGYVRPGASVQARLPLALIAKLTALFQSSSDARNQWEVTLRSSRWHSFSFLTSLKCNNYDPQTFSLRIRSAF